jgi:CHASE2 domain-containing sensor protein
MALLAGSRRRAIALLLLHLIGWLAFGPGIVLPGFPKDDWALLDQWIRTAIFTVVSPADRIPVTYVDIDNALYRDVWGMPPITPRNELAAMIDALSQHQPALILVDIDLAWGERDAALDEVLQRYRGPAPLVFVRHLDETAAGVRATATPYDATFAGNAAWLHWAHAYFYEDGDGALREWRPWVALCDDGPPQLLPAVAVIATRALRADAITATPPANACAQPDRLAVLPIVYTENFGFPARLTSDAVAMSMPGSAAQVMRAASLLDGTAVHADLLRQRVVIIGGSHTAGLDLRTTPIGVLPGAVVQANTILTAPAQLAQAGEPTWRARVTAAVLFLVLCLLQFPLAAALVAAAGVTAVGAFGYLGIVRAIEYAVLLYVQFRILAWVAQPFWRDLLGHGWRVVFPDYLREEGRDHD